MRTLSTGALERKLCERDLPPRRPRTRTRVFRRAGTGSDSGEPRQLPKRPRLPNGHGPRRGIRRRSQGRSRRQKPERSLNFGARART
jgi:hypothetical protein